MINLTNATKRYGRTKAIDGMTVNVLDNGIYCLLGRNGAGKTTMMKMIAGHINSTEGRVEVDGKKISPNHMPVCVNFIESNCTQFNMRVSDLIEAANSLQDNFDIGFARKMTKNLGLDENKKYKQLSFGMKTMLTTILCLSNNSKIILLDEPTLGFDAIMRDQFNTLLYESYELHPRIIIISTHLIDEIAKITQKLIIIDNGKLLVQTDINDVDERAYTLTGTRDTIFPLLKDLNCIGKTAVGSMVAAHIYDRRILPPQGVNMDSLSLQDFFINIVGGNSNEK